MELEELIDDLKLFAESLGIELQAKDQVIWLYLPISVETA